tara:strand:+ start:93 stop:407 length:315 start_codon:yes stop_codon:yes gene_type:complete
LLGQEVVITLGDASTRQGTVNDVDREGTVALRKVRRPGARVDPTCLARDETPRPRWKRSGAQENPTIRAAAVLAVMAAREDVFIFFGALAALASSSPKTKTHTA